MNLNAHLAEQLEVVATIDPQTVINSEQVSDYVDMSKYHQIIAIFLLGDMANETIDARLQEATDSSGPSAKAIKGATQLAGSAAGNDNKQIVISLHNDELDVAGSFRYVAARMITGNTTGGPAACVILGLPKTQPAGSNDLSTVVEIEVDHD